MMKVDFDKELENCAFVKASLMILVLMYHSVSFWGGNWFTIVHLNETNTILSIVADFLNSFHIYCFTLVSGYIFSFLIDEKGKYEQFGLFVKTKVKRLIVPYVFASLFWVIPVSNCFYHYSLKDLVVKYALATAPSQLWFLWMLFWIFMIVWPIHKFIKSDLFAVIFSAISFGLGTIGSTFGLMNVYSILTALCYIPFFVLGMKLRKNKSIVFRRIPIAVYTVIVLLLFIVWQLVKAKEGLFFSVLSLIIGFVLHVFGALMAFFVLHFLALKIDWKSNRIIKLLCDRSMTIYMVHQQIICISVYFLNERINPYINALINVVFSLLVSLLISSVLYRFKFTRFFIGEK